MQDYNLTDEEQQILDDLEAGKYVSVPNLEERKKQLKQYAKNTLNKTRNINLRLTERDFHKLKTKAIEEGMPYQTLAASILHKSVAK